MKMLTAAALIASMPLAAQAQTYALDAGHTEVRFFYNHAGVSEQSGEWGKIDGTVEFDPETPEATKINVTIDASSIDTGVEALDTHLKTADFFEIETYPTITFASTSAVQTSPENLRVTGDLTIKDQTHSVVLDVTLEHMGKHPVGQFLPYYEGEWVGVHASGSLLRSQFGVGFGAPLTSDHVRLEISSEMKAQ